MNTNNSGGQMLPLMEDFYTIQGEGYHSGKAAYFLRIGGCDVGCYWCDVKESWNPKLHPPTPVEEIVKRTLNNPSKTVVLTGGEPLLYNLDLLCGMLHGNGQTVHLETSGSHPLSGTFDWVCLSPKKNSPPLQEICSVADELKVIISDETDFKWAEKNARLVGQGCFLCLQPEWSRSSIVMPQIVEYVMQHPKWNVSLQTHKYMHIP